MAANPIPSQSPSGLPIEESCTSNLGAPPSLQELSALARHRETLRWPPVSPSLSEEVPPHRRGRLFLAVGGLIAVSVTVSLLVGADQAPLVSQREKVASGRTGVALTEGEQASVNETANAVAYPLDAILQSGTSFYIVVPEVTAADLLVIQNAQARNASVQVVCATAAEPTPDFVRKVVPGLILQPGVLVNGGRWLPVQR